MALLVPDVSQLRITLLKKKKFIHQNETFFICDKYYPHLVCQHLMEPNSRRGVSGCGGGIWQFKTLPDVSAAEILRNESKQETNKRSGGGRRRPWAFLLLREKCDARSNLRLGTWCWSNHKHNRTLQQKGSSLINNGLQL